MARGTTANERREAVEVVPLGAGVGDDVDDAFDKWREATAESEIPGKVTAWQIPMDADGVPQPSAKNQIRLGAWPVDAYAFDDLCALLIRDFMTPAGVLCVRLLGSKAESRGLQFNRVVTLRAPNTKPEPVNGAAPDSASVLMKSIQDNNERMLTQFKALLPQAPQVDAMTEMQRMIQFSRMMSEPTNKLLELLIPALVGRPPAAASAAEPFTQLSGLLDVFEKLQDMRGGGEGGGGGSDLVEAIRAVMPIAKPALEAIPHIMADRARTGAGLPQRTLPGPGQHAPRTAAAQPAPGSIPTQPQPTAPQPAAQPGDIPSGDQEMFAQLKPQIDALVQMAEQGSDPAGAGDMLFDQVILALPDDYYERLSEIIGGPNFVAQASVFNPKVAALADWFKAFAARVVERYDAEDAAAQSAPTVMPAAKPASG